MPENNTIAGIKACVFDAYGTLFDVLFYGWHRTSPLVLRLLVLEITASKNLIPFFLIPF